MENEEIDGWVKIIMIEDIEEMFEEMKTELTIDMIDCTLDKMQGLKAEPVNLVSKYALMIYTLECKEEYLMCREINDRFTDMMVKCLNCKREAITQMIRESISIYKNSSTLN